VLTSGILENLRISVMVPGEGKKEAGVGNGVCECMFFVMWEAGPQ